MFTYRQGQSRRWLLGPIIEDPHGLPAIILSLFPFTAPVTLTLRFLVTPVPAWQIALSVTVLVLCAAGAIWLAGRALRLASTFYVVYGAFLLIYICIITSSSLLRNSVGEERKNRVQEILFASVSPLQLLAGKFLGLGIVGLGQTLLWVVTGYVFLPLRGASLNLPAGDPIPASLIFWGVVFFVLSYAVYGTLLAGLGALTGPNVAGSGTADFVVIWPLLIPVFLASIIVQYPHSALAVGLSLFPLTASGGILMRLGVGGVPLWQPVLAVVLMLVTAYLTIQAVARMFRAQVLLTGQPVTVKRYVAMLLGRA